MANEVYRKLCETMARRGGRYPGMEIPEFYALAKELFSPEEAMVAAAMPSKPTATSTMAEEGGKNEEGVKVILESMAHKGLCSSFETDGNCYYVGSPFVSGIFEFQFMRATNADRDRRIARMIHAYKETVDTLAQDAPEIDTDRCFGCGICAVGCRPGPSK